MVVYLCDGLATCPGCTPPLAQWHLGEAPATLNWIKQVQKLSAWVIKCMFSVSHVIVKSFFPALLNKIVFTSFGFTGIYFSITLLQLSDSRSCKSSALHHCATQLVRGVCADMLRLVFSKHAAVHYDQTSPQCSRLYKGDCSRSLVVCSDATLQT